MLTSPSQRHLAVPPIHSLTKVPGFMHVVLSSRLGACWKCMSISLGMTVTCALGCVCSAQWCLLEDSPVAAWISVGAFAGTCLFGLLSLAHLILLAIRSTMTR